MMYHSFAKIYLKACFFMLRLHTHTLRKKTVSTFTVRDPKIAPFPTGDNICRHTKAHDNLSILWKNKAIKTENTMEQSVTV